MNMDINFNKSIMNDNEEQLDYQFDRDLYESSLNSFKDNQISIHLPYFEDRRDWWFYPEIPWFPSNRNDKELIVKDNDKEFALKESNDSFFNQSLKLSTAVDWYTPKEWGLF